jgi:hypothetical protein
VRRSLRDFQEQREPAAGLADLTAIMRIIDGAYDSNHNGGGMVEILGLPPSGGPS